MAVCFVVVFRLCQSLILFPRVGYTCQWCKQDDWGWYTDVPLKNCHVWNFPGGPVVKNRPSNVGDEGSIPGQGTKILHAGGGQLSSHTATRVHTVQLWKPVPQLERACAPQ